MLHRIGLHLRTNALGLVAIFIALGGTTYAAIGVPRGSVGAAQLRNHSITSVKFNRNSIAGSVRAWAVIGASGRVIASAGKPPVTAVSASSPGRYGIHWGVKLPKTCATFASIDRRSPQSAQTPVPLPSGGLENAILAYVTDVGTNDGFTGLDTFNQAGQPTSLAFDVAVIC